MPAPLLWALGWPFELTRAVGRAWGTCRCQSLLVMTAFCRGLQLSPSPAARALPRKLPVTDRTSVSSPPLLTSCLENSMVHQTLAVGQTCSHLSFSAPSSHRPMGVQEAPLPSSLCGPRQVNVQPGHPARLPPLGAGGSQMGS